ncbi:MAG: LPS assembly lipoprotein LptE [Sphingobium sp.]
MNRLAALLIALAVPLGGCGLRPVYSGGSHGAVAQTIGHIEVAPIEGKAGWLVHNALVDRLEPMAGGKSGGPTYRLVVALNDRITGFGVRLDNTVTRERRILRARYQLFDGPTGALVMDKTAGVDAGLDVAQSEYATVAAENTALERLAESIADQIIAQMAQHASATQVPPTVPTVRAAPPPAP